MATKSDISVYQNGYGAWVCAYMSETERVSQVYYFYSKSAAIRLFLEFLNAAGYR
jgi:hypothetical protein